MKIGFIILLGFLSLSNVRDEYVSEETFDTIFDLGVISTIMAYDQNPNLTRQEIRKLATEIANKKFDRKKLRTLLSEVK